MESLVRVIAEVGPGATWLMAFIATVIAVFVLNVGIALFATLRAPDGDQRTLRHEMFRELLDLFRRRTGE